MGTGTGIIVFAGVLAVAFMSIVAAPHAVRAWKDDYRARAYFWYFIGLAACRS